MKTIVCDLCGEIVKKINNGSIEAVKTFSSTSTKKCYDMCSDCFEKFNIFIKTNTCEYMKKTDNAYDLRNEDEN